MLSDPYPSKGTARSDAKIYAAQNGLTNFILLVDVENRKYHFSNEKIKPESKMIVFGRYKFSKGKWLEKPLAKDVKKEA